MSSYSSTSSWIPSEGTQSDAEEQLDNDALNELKTILEKHTHLFACGGEIPIVPSSTTHHLSSVTIRWDRSEAADKSACTKLTLPTANTDEINGLIEDTQAATFGPGGHDVLDESYRKALKMDANAFCTTFDPYSLGIIDVVAQVLLPTTAELAYHRSVRAELYKLNVYLGPNGKFKSHVDTPRSAPQFGSLVVCLPVKHEGGQLVVRHKKEQMTFDWGKEQVSADSWKVHWAAFYSDCEHEVLEVSNGCRLTLTYNLYYVRGAGRLTGTSSTLNPSLSPLYNAVKATLARDPFGGLGGTLGFWCTHAYPYNQVNETPLPDSLKGLDAVLWEVFKALGLSPQVAPVIKLDKYDRDEISSTIHYRQKRPQSRYGPVMNSLNSQRPSKYLVGKNFGICLDDSGQLENPIVRQNLYQSWGEYNYERIQWLTSPDPDTSEFQMAYTAYGNEATSEYIYSHCAILVHVPAKEN